MVGLPRIRHYGFYRPQVICLSLSVCVRATLRTRKKGKKRKKKKEEKKKISARDPSIDAYSASLWCTDVASFFFFFLFFWDSPSAERLYPE